jgi:RNA polymerase sigma-70 factor (ECF subfamily)
MYHDETKLGGVDRAFPETVGGLVGRLSSGPADVRRAAAEDLCRAYWKPVYHWLRLTRARSNDEAKDLAQAFFLWILEAGPLERYDTGRGGFRPFLKSLLKHYVQHHEEALGRLKRGGHLRFVPVDADLQEPGETDPGRAFDAAWRGELVERAVAAVRRRYQDSGRGVRFQAFEAYEMAPPDGRPTYAQIATRLGVRETDVHNHLVRVREELRLEIRAELGRMIADPSQLEEEWREFVRGS